MILKSSKLNKILIAFLILFFIPLIGITRVNAQVNGNDYAIVTDVSLPIEDQGGIQRVKLEIKSGKYSNSFFDSAFKSPTANIKHNLSKGDVVLVKFITGSLDDKVQSVEIVDIYRLPNVFWAPILFILVLLVTVVAKYKRKVFIFLSVILSMGISTALIIFFKINPIPVVIATYSISFFTVLFIVYKKIMIAAVGLLIPIILGIFAVLLSFITLQVTSIQLSYLSVISSFYDIANSDYADPFYTAVLISSLTGAMYIAYQQILESIKIKISDIEVSKKELTVKSFKHMTKTLDTIIFPSLGFLFGIIASVLIFLQRSMGIEAALNNDYWVSLSILATISLIIWVLTVPISALLCGIILGRLEQHKIVTDKTISILD